VEVPDLGIGGWVTLTLTQHATPEQLQRWIWPTLLGDLVWCQLFSEPNAGSDAAAVQTTGVRVEGGWRVSGQKVWTSNAQCCNRGLATVRTDSVAPKHKRITTMVVDLRAAGVEIRPLREITGEAVFNEVFLDDVFVPDSDVVGRVNEGWSVARATLGNERLSIGARPQHVAAVADLIDLLARCAPDDAGLRREFGSLVADEQAVQLINLRRVTRAVAGGEPGAEGNITKLLASELAQRSTELALQVVGRAAADGSEPSTVHDFLFSRCFTIAGGTSEIARNVIAERLLGLPREPRAGV
jgi:alkylation response protein AidB-like acyl-CoA dehydrogenase